MNEQDVIKEELERLEQIYKNTWSKEVDYTILPQGLTQKKLVKCLELMIENNYSLLVAYNKLKEVGGLRYD